MTSYIKVTSRLGTGISKSFFYGLTLRRRKYLRKQRLQGEWKSGQRFLPSPYICAVFCTMFAHSASLATPSKQNIQGCSNPCCISNCFFVPPEISNKRKVLHSWQKMWYFSYIFSPIQLSVVAWMILKGIKQWERRGGGGWVSNVANFFIIGLGSCRSRFILHLNMPFLFKTHDFFFWSVLAKNETIF